MSRQAKHRLTPEEYLAIERAAEFRSEYFDGEMFMMSGASRAHILIVGNILYRIRQQFDDRDCEIYTNDMRVRIPATGLYAYPDVVAVCGEPRFDDNVFDTLNNPTVIIEVLSESTASYDRGFKFVNYRTIETLKEYLVVAQHEYKVEHYTKESDGSWRIVDVHGLDKTIQLAAIECALKLEDIYARVTLSEVTETAQEVHDRVTGRNGIA